MINTSLAQLEAKVLRFVNSIKDSPKARYQSRQDFYLKYGHGEVRKYGYGSSELAFMRWEERGVMQESGGSAWWNAVNLRFIYLSELGAAAYEAGLPKKELPIASQKWIDFINKPSARSWYRAHNSSIIDGYLEFPYLAEQEKLPEQVFINMVLYRVLFAQAMVEGTFFSFPLIGKYLADPRGPAVGMMTHMDAFYPSHYPMTKEEVRDILGKARNFGEWAVQFMDYVMVLPELNLLYQMTASCNDQPDLMKWIKMNHPTYPDGKAKDIGRENWSIKVIAWLRNKWLKVRGFFFRRRN